MTEFSEFTNHAIEMAKNAGAVLMEYFHKETLEVERKGYNDIATEADKAAEKLIIDSITAKYPEHSILAEESGEHLHDSDYWWIIDPLDGTTNFKHRLPIFSVSIALVVKNEVQVGVVYNPYIDELFVAEKGKGAYLNGEPIHVTDAEGKEMTLMATGFAPDKKLVEENLIVFDHLIKEGYLLRRLGSAAIDLAYVACGRFDAFWEFSLKPWDVAAGSLIVEEAGGKVTDDENKPLDLTKIPVKSIVSSNAKLHEKLLELIKKAHES
ncbi:inositol monophosphatase family protein [Patescibacteria group bacterium]